MNDHPLLKVVHVLHWVSLVIDGECGLSKIKREFGPFDASC